LIPSVTVTTRYQKNDSSLIPSVIVTTRYQKNDSSLIRPNLAVVEEWLASHENEYCSKLL
jgi:hypothetical protein